jgi:hypothetical protein
MVAMDEKDGQKPSNLQDPVKQAEDLYFALSDNITIEAKNIIYHCIQDAKNYYYNSIHTQAWERILTDLQDIINDFENQLSQQGELKLIALQKNLEELKNKEQQ